MSRQGDKGKLDLKNHEIAFAMREYALLLKYYLFTSDGIFDKSMF